MFIRQVKKKNSSSGKTFYQYQLLQAARVAGKVKHQNILYLGSEPILADKDARKKLLDLVQAKIFDQPLLFAKDYPSAITALAESYYQKLLKKLIGNNTSNFIDMVKQIFFSSIELCTIDEVRKILPIRFRKLL